MRCPFCTNEDTQVVDTRSNPGTNVIRRRRRCTKCDKRFTTYERVEELTPLIVKKDGRREAFDREKVMAGLKKACEKRPVSMERIEQTADRIERMLQERGEMEVASSVIGEAIMKALCARFPLYPDLKNGYPG